MTVRLRESISYGRYLSWLQAMLRDLSLVSRRRPEGREVRLLFERNRCSRLLSRVRVGGKAQRLVLERLSVSEGVRGSYWGG